MRERRCSVENSILALRSAFDQVQIDKPLFDDMADGAVRDFEFGCEDSEPDRTRSFSQESQVLLLVKSKTKAVEVFQLERAFKMVVADQLQPLRPRCSIR